VSRRKCTTLSKATICAAITLGLSLTARTPVAHAATSCSSGLSFAVHFDTSRPIYGTQASILSHNPLLCTTGDPGSSSSVWVMIAGNGNGYAQSGYVRFANFPVARYFYEYNGQGDTQYVDPNAIGGGETHFYKAYVNSGNGQAVMVRDSYVIGVTPWFVGAYWPSPYQTQISGETHDAGDDMPGTAGNPTYFTNIQEEYDYNVGFQRPTAGFNQLQGPGAPRYGSASSGDFSQYAVYTQ